MEITLKKRKNTLLVNVFGELDHHNADYIRDKIDERLKTNAVKHVILDFSKLDFMDSSGVGMILGRYKKIKAKHGKLVVANLTPQVRRVFEISGLFNIIKEFKSIKEAFDYIEEV